MRWRVLAIGRPKLAYARAGIEEYAGRIQPFAPLELEYLKAGTREAESAALAERCRGAWRIVLDERGEQITSRALAAKIGQWEQQRLKEIGLLIGGAEGHTESLRSAGDWRWSLATFTLQHELALVVALEQIYRAYTIKAGLPYHRD